MGRGGYWIGVGEATGRLDSRLWLRDDLLMVVWWEYIVPEWGIVESVLTDFAISGILEECGRPWHSRALPPLMGPSGSFLHNAYA